MSDAAVLVPNAWRPATVDRRDLLLVVAAYLVARAAFVGSLVLVAGRRSVDPVERLGVFDGAYYGRIATDWYPDRLVEDAGGLAMSEIAFFPLFPTLLAGPVALGAPVEVAALVLNTVAGAVATVTVYLLVLGWTDRATAVAAAALWSVVPSGFVLSLTYSEALYSMLVAGCLLLVLQERWFPAAGVAVAATLTRPTGVVLVAVLVAAMVMARRAGRIRLHVGLVLAPVLAASGFAGFLLYLGQRYDRYDVWFATQREGWGVWTDGGLETSRRTVGYLLDPTERPAATGVAVLVLALALLLVVSVLRRRTPLPLLLFAAATFVLAYTTRNAFSSFPRFVLPATWVLLVPVLQVLLARLSGPVRVAAVAALFAGGVVVMSALGVYVVLDSAFPP